MRVGFDDVRATVNGVSRTFDMDDFDTIQMAGTFGNDTMTLGNGIEGVQMNGGVGDDRITGNDRQNEILGEDGADTINGGGGDDLIVGQGGNDTIDGGSGVDHIHGNDGNDTVTGGAGVDDLSGDEGDDTLFARDGLADRNVDGGPGFDRARVDPGDPLESIDQILA